MTEIEKADLYESKYPKRREPVVADEKIITMDELKDRCIDYACYCKEGFNPAVYSWGTSFYTLKDINISCCGEEPRFRSPLKWFDFKK